jgi:hypothetical protein
MTLRCVLPVIAMGAGHTFSVFHQVYVLEPWLHCQSPLTIILNLGKI